MCVSTCSSPRTPPPAAPRRWWCSSWCTGCRNCGHTSPTVIIIIISHLLVVLRLLDHLYLVDALLAGGHGVEVHANLALALLHLPAGGALQVLNLGR